MKRDSVYLPGLNGLRAIAAIAVIISHTGLALEKFGLENSKGYSLASFGVTIFFTLSGFLITYLLLCEKEIKNTIVIKKFYIRRILRIWPLYFIFLLIVLLYIKFNVNASIWYYVFILPNIPFALNAAAGGVSQIPYLGHYWSLGVEEQFYAFWPFVVNKIKNLKQFLILFIICFFMLKIILSVTNTFKILQVFLYYTRFGCLAIGGFGAYLFYLKVDFLNYLKKPVVELFAWCVILLIGINKFHVFSIIDHELVSIITLIIIYNQIDNPKKILSLENKIFDYLGKISFGMYVYNPLLIAILASCLREFNYINSMIFIPLIYLSVFLTVILVSHISYYSFEIKFLELKHKFTTVHSAASKSEFESQI